MAIISLLPLRSYTILAPIHGPLSVMILSLLMLSINLWPQTETHVTNGVCYWLNCIGEIDDPTVRNILCFDFRNNQFRKLKPPPTDIRSRYEFVTEFNDSIAYVITLLHPEVVQVCILEQDSWTKKIQHWTM